MAKGEYLATFLSPTRKARQWLPGHRDGKSDYHVIEMKAVFKRYSPKKKKV